MASVKVVVFGGRALPRHSLVPPTAIHVPSRRNGGAGPIRGLRQQLQRGAVSLLLVDPRWAGHSDFRSLKATARRAGVPVKVLTWSTAGMEE